MNRTFLFAQNLPDLQERVGAARRHLQIFELHPRIRRERQLLRLAGNRTAVGSEQNTPAVAIPAGRGCFPSAARSPGWCDPAGGLEASSALFPSAARRSWGIRPRGRIRVGQIALSRRDQAPGCSPTLRTRRNQDPAVCGTGFALLAMWTRSGPTGGRRDAPSPHPDAEIHPLGASLVPGKQGLFPPQAWY